MRALLYLQGKKGGACGGAGGYQVKSGWGVRLGFPPIEIRLFRLRVAGTLSGKTAFYYYLLACLLLLLVIVGMQAIYY